MQFWQAEVVVLQIENFTFFNARESPVGFRKWRSCEISQGNKVSDKHLWHKGLSQVNTSKRKSHSAKDSVLQAKKQRMTTQEVAFGCMTCTKLGDYPLQFCLIFGVFLCQNSKTGAFWQY